jgi:hypothetical protein
MNVRPESNNPEVTREVLRQMREEGKSYENDTDNALSSTSVSYSYDKVKLCFKCYYCGNVMGGTGEFEMTEAEMMEVISKEHIYDLRASGFTV